jgi:MoaA/NifB/PqqE/SkfB family radical SAM enzyme
MTDEQIFALIDAACENDVEPKIGLSGGEAFLYFERLCTIIKYAAKKYALVSVNTNGFWGKTLAIAVEKVRIIKEAGLKRLVVSIDDFHEEYINREAVLNVIKACKKVHLEVEIQFVATKKSRRLADFLKDCGDVLLNVSCREIPCHPVGRAREKIEDNDLFLKDYIPDGLCPSAVLSVSAYGKVIPCCNTAGHLPSLQVGTIEQPLQNLYEKFLDDPTIQILQTQGPKALLEAATEAGYVSRPDGYVDQCHLCYELFKDENIACAVKEFAINSTVDDFFQEFLQHYKSETINATVN